ncbi:hypothetical protein B0H17DRAFT_1068334 [Mycena rosella]|uniref:Manganese/iron superoxide dismutase C-terminal domain-containing protein n=1 Tax=Mycena rosella TaxID=1033263 RepID=A0AAD7DCE0_MYCRO|nr:hypothetical protein B0H17DRAFT_1068334 [Mycena rosella]
MSFLWRCRHSLIRARSPLIPRGTRGVTGQFDHLPLPLPYRIEDGLGDFLPPQALEAVAMEYQLGLLARLTDEVRRRCCSFFAGLYLTSRVRPDTEDEDSSVTQVVLNTAPFREKTLAFNYASLALNNSFFLTHLTPDPEESHEAAISLELHSMIRTDHGGLENFKSAVSAAAMGMFTSGYVWFVCDRNGSTSILPTLGPGTLLIRSRSYMAQAQPDLYQHNVPTTPFAWDREMKYMSKYLEDWNADGPDFPFDPKQLGPLLGREAPPAEDPSASASQPLPPPPTGPARRFLHTSAYRSQEFNDAPGVFDSTPTGLYAGPTQRPRGPPRTKVDAIHAGEVLFPLFCVSVHEHAWITAGYGVWGKEAWLREFWSVLNWRRVSESYARIRSTTD